MAYIGREPLYGAYEKQSITADSSTTTFTLDYVVGSASSIFVSVAGVPQEPSVAYNIINGGTQIQFTAAPTSGDTVFVIFLGAALDVATFGSSAINGLTELTAPVGADELVVYDSSATANKKITLDNLVAGQTDLTTGIQGADELLIYDSSATEVKKVNLDNLITGQTELATTAADDDVLLIYDTSETEIKKIQKSNIASAETFTSLVQDTTPQLGGALDINSQEITGSLIPDTTDTYDLGSSSKVWANIYTGDLNLSNEAKEQGNDVDGTKGSWTIQEGADNLYLINNNSGKKYKFTLEEI